MSLYKFFTSESVTEGHPDKVCDQISDAILDFILTQDPNARVACETVASKGLILITGEITTTASVPYEEIARGVLSGIGYTDEATGLNGEACEIIVRVSEQSPDIAQGVDGEETGAGDQGMMFGYATNETEQYMPLPIHLAHRLSQQLARVRKDQTIPYLKPDGKTQVVVAYDEAGNPAYIETILISTQHEEGVSTTTLNEDIVKHVIWPVIPALLFTKDTRVLINPTGRFVEGGPAADAGLTGRKIIVDTYGGYARHGGGAFSGKDATKVDRSGAYMARYIAKNVVAAGLADRCEIQLSYSIGIAEPTGVFVDTFGTGKLSDIEIADLIREVFDLRPQGIIQALDLKQPIYKPTAAYGHFGRDDVSLPWERLDKTEVLKQKI